MPSGIVKSRYYLNIRPGYMAPVTLHCSYGDSGTPVTFYIYDGNEALDLNGSIVSLHGTRKDGCNFGPFSCTPSGNAVTFTLQTNITGSVGGGIAEFTITKDGATVGTANFAILVENAVFPLGYIADNDVSVYQDILSYVQSIPSQITGEYMSRLNAEITARVNGDAANSAETTQQISSVTSSIDLLSERVDSLIGSTQSGDEVTDIRTGANGHTYDLAGNAVRGQISDLEYEITNTFMESGEEYTELNPYNNGSYYWDKTAPAISTFFMPLTVKKMFVLEKLKFKTTYTASGTLTISIKEKSTNIIKKTVTTSVSSGLQTVNIAVGVLLVPQEYQISVSVSSGTLAYPSIAGLSQSYINNLYFTNKGTTYYVNNSNIVFVGDITILRIPDLHTGNIGIGEKLIDTKDEIITATGITYDSSTGIITQTYSGSGNSWWQIPIRMNQVVNSFIRFELNIVSISGAITLYLMGKDTSGNANFIRFEQVFSETGKHTWSIDLNYHAVYNALDLSSPVTIAVANQTSSLTATYDVANVYTDLVNLDTSASLNTVLDNLSNSVTTAVGTVSSTVRTSVNTVAPNGDRYSLQVLNDGSIVAIPAIPANTLFVGNSLLLGNGTFGMNATDNQHDYYYYMSNKITSLKSGATYDKLSGTTFEGATTAQEVNTWLNNTLLPKLSSSLNLVVVQLGDNVNTAEKVSNFRTSCKTMLQFVRTNAPNAKVVWVGEWYSTTEKQSIISDACDATGCIFIDISDLATTTNKSTIGTVVHRTSSYNTTYTVTSYSANTSANTITLNFAVNGSSYTATIPYTSYTENSSTSVTVTSEYVVTTSNGVASHPGNNGMRAIANRICYKLGITSSENEI